MQNIIHLVRHGQTLFTGNTNNLGQSDSKIVAGSTDVALSASGEAAATRLASSLQLATIDEFFSSNLKRAKRTATLLGATLINEDERLRELNFGAWEGLNWAQVHEQYPKHLAEWADNWVERAPPEGESFSALAIRSGEWLTEVLNDTSAKTVGASDSRQLVVCAHAGTIRALLCSALDLPLHHAMKFSIDYVHVTTLDYNDGAVKCSRVNAQQF